jgi:hypothetical protein
MQHSKQLIDTAPSHAPEECAAATTESLETQIRTLLPGKPAFVRLVRVGMFCDQNAGRR